MWSVTMVNLILPYPPSTNTYWRKWHNHMVIGPAGKAFRQKVINIIAPMELQPITGFVRMQIKVYADSNRKRDVDNNLKALLDALTHAKVWIDDYQVKAISIERMNKDPNKIGYCEVQIECLTTENS